MRSKKVISLVLSLLMIFSVMQASFAAFALDSEKLAAAEAAINSFDGNLSVAEPTSDDLEGYENIVTIFKALSADEKDAMDVLAFDKLYHKAIDRERQLSIKNNPDLKSYDSKHYTNAHNATEAALGSFPSYMDEAITLNSVFADKKATSQNKLNAFANASKNARIYADCYNASYKMFYYAIASNPAKTFVTLVTAISKDLVNADPFKEAKPSKLSKPNPKNYADGENDPEYIAAYNAYWKSLEVYQIWDAASKNHTAAKNLEAMNMIAAVAAEYKNIVDTATLALEAKKEYDADSSKKDKAADAVEAYNALSDFEKLQYDKLGTYLYYIAEEKSTYWSTTSFNAAKLYSACVDIGNSKFVDEFIAVMETIEEPYTRSDIEKAKAAYALVPSTLISSIDSDVIAKYKAVLASIGPDEQNKDKPSTEEFETTSVKYPVSYGKKEVTNAIDSLFDVVLDVIGTDEAKLETTLTSTVFSSAFIGTLCKKLYPLLGGLNSLVAYGPNDLANKLTEEKYQLAAQKLKAATTVDENGKVIKDMADWDKVTFVNGDFGFQDGDKDAFLDAAAAIFRPVSIITMVISLENSVSTANGTYVYGAYEDLIPVLEALDLNLVVSSDEYTKNVNAAESAVQMDARVRPILAPIADLIERVAQDPVNTVLDVLPKLAYALKTDLVSAQINKLISKMKMISLDPVDLSTEAVFDIINKEIRKLETSKGVSITLDKAEFVATMDTLAGCGKYVVKESVSRENAYRVGLNSDKTDAFMVLYRYLYKELVSNGNAAQLLDLINNSENTLAKFAVKIILKVIPNRNGDLALKIIGRFLPIIKLVLAMYKVLLRIQGLK